MKTIAGLVIVLAAWTSAELVQAAELSSTFTLETTRVLPSGVRNPRFIHVFTGIDGKYGGVGQAEPLGQPLFRPVTPTLVLKTQDDDAKRATIAGLVKSKHLQNEALGTTTGSVSMFANIKVPALAYGITERFTLAVAVPIVAIDVNADTGFIPTQAGRDFVGAAAESSPALGDEAAQKLARSVDQKLEWAGMETIRPFEQRGIGDMQVVGKFLLHDTGYQSFALKETLIVPTGTYKPNPNRALDVPTSDGRYGIGTQGIYNQEVMTGMTFVSTLGYTAYLPRTIVKRLPDAADDPISRDKEALHENLRHLFTATTGLEQRVDPIGMAFTGGYSLQYQSQVKYQPGLMAQGDRLVWLENLQPSQTLHSLIAGATFSTVSWYRRKQFVYPFEIKMAYSRPLSGRNATTNELVAAELVLFF